VNEIRMLVLSASFGNGHIRAAEAVIEAISSKVPTATITHLDFGDFIMRPFNSVMKNTYIEMIKYFPKSYGRFYYRTAKIEPDSLFQRFLNSLGHREFIRFINSYNPDVIICTYPTITGVLAQLRSKKILDIPLAAIVTDYTVHNQWIHQGVDQYIVGSQDVCEGFVDRGIERRRIQVTGIPVNPKFELELNRQKIFDELGLNSNRPTILVMGGADGVLCGAKRTCNFLGNIETPVQILVVCGKDENMYKYVVSVSDTTYNPIRCFGYVDNIEEFMTAADLIVTKAGGLTVSEALTKGVPLLIYKPIPGQEEENANYIKKIGAGKISHTFAEFERTVSYLLKHPLELEKMSLAARKYTPRFSAQHAADTILTLQQSSGLIKKIR
jgi:processive 1,2-diacylglycerol beta-glucosyltransferase